MLANLPWAERVGILLTWVLFAAVTFFWLIGFAHIWTWLGSLALAALFTFLAVWIANGKDLAATEAELEDAAGQLAAKIKAAEEAAAAKAREEWSKVIGQAKPNG
jgi:hypothetical protein